MKKIDLIPVYQCIACVVLCCVALSIQSVYPHSNIISFVAALGGLLFASLLSYSGSRRGAEYSIAIMLGIFVLSWIIVPIVFIGYFEGDKIIERRMWADIYSLLFIPFMGVCYEHKYAY